MSGEDNYFIYGLQDPRNNELKYIGITKNIPNRLAIHIQHSKKPRYLVNAWVRELYMLNLVPIIFILESGITNKKQAEEIESEYVAYFKAIGCELTNINHIPNAKHLPKSYKNHFGNNQKSPAAKFTPDTVKQIRYDYEHNKLSHSQIAKKYNSNKSTIGRMLRKETYSLI